MSIPSNPGMIAQTVTRRTLVERWLPSLKFLVSTEVHVYAFAIAFNVLLSFIPFAVLMLVFTKSVLHSDAAYAGVLAGVRDAVPSNADFIAKNLQITAASRKSSVFSLILLLFTGTGALLPLEVALNRIWGIRKNRSYLMNQIVSFGLAFGCGALVLFSLVATGAQLSAVKDWMGGGTFASVVSWLGMKVIALPVNVAVLFVLYYLLPNGKVPAMPMLRAAVFAGVLMEVGKYIYILTLPWLDFRGVYGPFSVSVTLLFWAFLASLILLVGAHASATPEANA